MSSIHFIEVRFESSIVCSSWGSPHYRYVSNCVQLYCLGELIILSQLTFTFASYAMSVRQVTVGCPILRRKQSHFHTRYVNCIPNFHDVQLTCVVQYFPFDSSYTIHSQATVDALKGSVERLNGSHKIMYGRWETFAGVIIYSNSYYICIKTHDVCSIFLLYWLGQAITNTGMIQGRFRSYLSTLSFLSWCNVPSAISLLFLLSFSIVYFEMIRNISVYLLLNKCYKHCHYREYNDMIRWVHTKIIIQAFRKMSSERSHSWDSIAA